MVLDLATIPVDKYAAWRSFLQRIDGMMHRTVRLVPDRRGAPAVRPVAGGGKPTIALPAPRR